MGTVTIGGFVVGAVDSVASVAAARDTYNNSPNAATFAAYNAAVANAYAAESALVPVAGSYFASQAVTAGIKDIQLNGLTPGKAVTFIGNVVTMLGQGVQIADLSISPGLATNPITLGAGLGAFSIGEAVDAVGLLFNVAGAALDSTEIANYIQESAASLGLGQDSSGNYIASGQTNTSAFVCGPNGDSLFISGNNGAPLSTGSSVYFDTSSGQIVTNAGNAAITTDVSMNLSPNGTNLSVTADDLVIQTITVTAHITDSNASVNLGNNVTATNSGTGNQISLGNASVLTDNGNGSQISSASTGSTGATLFENGNNSQVFLNNAGITVATGAVATINGITNIVTAGDNANLTLTGNGNILSCGANDILNSGTFAETVYASAGSDTISVGGSSTVTLGGTGNSLTCNGSGATINMSASASGGLTLSGDTLNLNGNNAWCSISGTGNTVTTASGVTGDSTIVLGNSNTLDPLSAGNSFTLLGTGETLNSGTFAESVYAYSASNHLTVGGGSTVSLSGNGNRHRQRHQLGVWHGLPVDQRRHRQLQRQQHLVCLSGTQSFP